MDYPYHQCNKVLYGDQAWCRCGHCYRPPQVPNVGYSHGFPPVPTQPPSFPRSTFTAQGPSGGWQGYRHSQSYRQSWHGNTQNLQARDHPRQFDPSTHYQSIRRHAPVIGETQYPPYPQSVSFNASRLLNGPATVDSYRPVYSVGPPRQSYPAPSARGEPGIPSLRLPTQPSKYPQPRKVQVSRSPPPKILLSQPISLDTNGQGESTTSKGHEVSDGNATKVVTRGEPPLSWREQLQADRALLGVTHTANRKE